jgi:G3E family GTPase
MPTPLVLITGFLGAGKTSLVRHLLPLLSARQVPGHVIINDYGNAVFDAETLQGLAASVEEVSGSCVCCDSLDALLLSIQQTQTQGPAVILVEANGTTDVPSLLEILAMSRSTRHCTPPIQVAVVDADNWQLFLAQKASPMAPPSLMQLPRAKPPSSMLVFIGAALDEDRLRDHLAQLTQNQRLGTPTASGS